MSDDYKGPDFWAGKPVRGMSRAELLGVIEHMNRIIDERVEAHQRTLDRWNESLKAREARRA